jgi:hypothetical protein
MKKKVAGTPYRPKIRRKCSVKGGLGPSSKVSARSFSGVCPRSIEASFPGSHQAKRKALLSAVAQNKDFLKAAIPFSVIESVPYEKAVFHFFSQVVNSNLHFASARLTQKAAKL